MSKHLTTMESLSLAASTGTDVSLSGEQAKRVLDVLKEAARVAPFTPDQSPLQDAVKRLGL